MAQKFKNLRAMLIADNQTRYWKPFLDYCVCIITRSLQQLSKCLQWQQAISVINYHKLVRFFLFKTQSSYTLLVITSNQNLSCRLDWPNQNIIERRKQKFVLRQQLYSSSTHEEAGPRHELASQDYGITRLLNPLGDIIT